jgi:hypothetical protein
VSIAKTIINNYSNKGVKEEEKKLKALKNSLSSEKLDDLLCSLAKKPETSRNLESEKIHVSSAISFCPRLHYYSREANTINTTNFMPSMQVIFELGKAAEMLVKKLLINLDKENTVIIGAWTKDKKDKKKTHLGFKPDGEDWEYEEVDLTYLDDEIKGHPDILMLDNLGEVKVIEVKSVSRRGYNEILANDFPLHKHAMQATFYRQMLAESGMLINEKTNKPYIISRTAKIIYVCRDYLTKEDLTYNPFKEFEINTTDNIYLNPFLENVRLVEEYLNYKEIGEVPTTKVCESYTCEKAKECLYVSRCFNE